MWPRDSSGIWPSDSCHDRTVRVWPSLLPSTPILAPSSPPRPRFLPMCVCILSCVRHLHVQGSLVWSGTKEALVLRGAARGLPTTHVTAVDLGLCVSLGFLFLPRRHWLMQYLFYKLLSPRHLARILPERSRVWCHTCSSAPPAVPSPCSFERATRTGPRANTRSSPI